MQALGNVAQPATTRAGLAVNSLRVDLAASSLDIVSDVSFDCPPGAAIGIVGESGSGKTTVGMALLGYARPGMQICSGEVMIDGTDILAMDRARATRARGHVISYVPQEPGKALSPAMRVGRQIAEMLDGEHSDRHLRRERVVEACDAAQLSSSEEMLRRYPHELSGGQQQRVAIAMALVSKPRVVVMDEPTTGLDVIVQARLLEVIRSIRSREQTSIVYISHDLGVVRNLVESVVVLYGGRIVETGSVEQIFRRPAHPYTRRLLAAVPRVDSDRRRLRGIPGSTPEPGSRPRGCPFSPRCEFSIELCEDSMPELTTRTGHAARCWRAGEDAIDLEKEAPDRGTYGSNEAPSKPLLLVADLTAGYRQKVSLFRRTRDTSTIAVESLSLTIAEGECVAIVGESGSGKTTFARCIAGLHPRMAGEMIFAGLPVSTAPRRRTAELQQSIQMVFQDPDSSLNPQMSVAQLIGRPLKRFFDLAPPERRSTLLKLLEQVHLDSGYAKRYPAELSGGEKQRVALARALAARPKLLVCDEITSALDVAVQASILELLLELRSQLGMAMLFISHDLAVVRVISDKVYVLRSGELRDSGATETVFAAPRDLYTKQLLAAVPDLLPGDYPATG